MATAWAHLPNAAHIDGIIADVKARPKVWDAAWGAAWGAILALITWDDSADMLRMTPEALRVIIDTCDGKVKHQAVLLLPAVLAGYTV